MTPVVLSLTLAAGLAVMAVGAVLITLAYGVVAMLAAVAQLLLGVCWMSAHWFADPVASTTVVVAALAATIAIGATLRGALAGRPIRPTLGRSASASQPEPRQGSARTDPAYARSRLP